MIHLGVRAHDYGKNTPANLFHKIRGDGFDSVQLAFQKAIAGVERFRDVTPDVIDKAGKAAQSEQIHIAVLGVYIEPSLVNDALRQTNVSDFVNSIPIAKKLRADCIGTETTKRELQPQVSQKEALDALYRSLWTFMDAAEAHEVTVAIEPVAAHTVNTPECAAEVVKTIASPYLKVIFDPVNLLTPENVSEQDALWDRFFELLGGRIAAVHLKGVRLNSQGRLVGCPFPNSLLHYNHIAGGLKKLPYDFSVLREEIEPANAREDLRFLQELFVDQLR